MSIIIAPRMDFNTVKMPMTKEEANLIVAHESVRLICQGNNPAHIDVMINNWLDGTTMMLKPSERVRILRLFRVE